MKNVDAKGFDTQCPMAESILRDTKSAATDTAVATAATTGEVHGTRLR